MAVVEQQIKADVYRPSGNTGDFAWLLWFVVSFFLIPLTSGIYAHIILWMPITFLNPLFTYLFSLFGLSMIHNILVLEYGQVRSVLVARQMGIGTFIVSLVSHWVVWLALTENGPFWSALAQYGRQPTEIWNQFIHVYNSGTWWGPGGVWTGWLLACVWISETAMIYRTFLSSVVDKVNEPYCEKSKTWHVCRTLPPTQFLPEMPVNQLKQGNDHSLRLIQKEDASQSHSEIILYYSPAHDYYVSISNKAKKETKDGMGDFTSWSVVSHLHVGQSVGQHLQGVLEGFACYLKDASFKNDLINSFGFSSKEVQDGERRYRNAISDTLRTRLVWVDRMWHPRLGQVDIIDFYGKMPAETIIALLSFIQHEPANYHKQQLAEKFSEILLHAPGELKQIVSKIAESWHKVEINSTIQEILSNALRNFNSQSGSQTKLEPTVQKKMEDDKLSTEFTYKCRPGYGSDELMIEIHGAEDEFFLQDFLNIISEIHPRGGSPGIEEMHAMLSSGDVEWEGETDAGKISFHQDSYGTAFVMAEKNNTAIPRIDQILRQNDRFTRVDVNFDDYK